MNDVELLMQRRQTKAFIRADSVKVQLQRRTRTQTAAGGVSLGAPTTLDPQIVRFIPVSRVKEALGGSTAGRVSDADLVLLAEHHADVKLDDELEHHGRWYVISAVDEVDKDYRVVAALQEKGRAE